jgi:hypothetical protein
MQGFAAQKTVALQDQPVDPDSIAIAHTSGQTPFTRAAVQAGHGLRIRVERDNVLVRAIGHKCSVCRWTQAAC